MVCRDGMGPGEGMHPDRDNPQGLCPAGVSAVFESVGKGIDSEGAGARHDKNAGIASKGPDHGVCLITSITAGVKQMVGCGGVKF